MINDRTIVGSEVVDIEISRIRDEYKRQKVYELAKDESLDFQGFYSLNNYYLLKNFRSKSIVNKSIRLPFWMDY